MGSYVVGICRLSYRSDECGTKTFLVGSGAKP